jgi:hypothetical protein
MAFVGGKGEKEQKHQGQKANTRPPDRAADLDHHHVPLAHYA